MPVSAVPAFDDLGAPPRSGDVLIAPPLADWPAVIERNRKLRRRQLPKLLKIIHGSAITESARGDSPASDSATADSAADGPGARCSLVRADGPPLIVTGHQPEFFHPGVWAKNVAAVQVARRLEGIARFVAVGHDTPDGLKLLWPDGAAAVLTARALELPQGSRGTTYEQQPPLGDDAWRAVWSQLPAGLRERGDLGLRAFLEGFEKGNGRALDGASDYIRRWARGIAALDRAIGVETPQVATLAGLSTGADDSLQAGAQPQLQSCAPPVAWGEFAAYLLTHAADAAGAYNAALADYRSARGIGDSGRPIPDLQIEADRIESPLWAWRGDGPRQRVHVAANSSGAGGGASGVRVFAGSREIGVLTLASGGAAAEGITPDGGLHGWRLRPRALMLTCYLRLFAADLFVHGLGGAKYDAMTDGFIRRLFEVEPPAYACVTATLRLELPALPVSAAELFAARRAARDARFNPQRSAGFVPPSNAEDADRLRLLLHDRAAAINESERLRRDEPRARQPRRLTYERIHSLNGRIAALSPALGERAAAAIESLRARQAAAAVAASREWFYGLYPLQALRELAGQIASHS